MIFIAESAVPHPFRFTKIVNFPAVFAVEHICARAVLAIDADNRAMRLCQKEYIRLFPQALQRSAAADVLFFDECVVFFFGLLLVADAVLFLMQIRALEAVFAAGAVLAEQALAAIADARAKRTRVTVLSILNIVAQLEPFRL